MEDLSVQVCKEAIICKVTIVSKALPTARWGGQDNQGRCWLEASARHRDAAISTDGCNDRRHHEGDLMAAALGAWLSCWRGAQAPCGRACMAEREYDLRSKVAPFFRSTAAEVTGIPWRTERYCHRLWALK
jgi:hypothetical protein